MITTYKCCFLCLALHLIFGAGRLFGTSISRRVRVRLNLRLFRHVVSEFDFLPSPRSIENYNI